MTMSYKLTTLCFILALILFTSSAARPEPAFSDASPVKHQRGDHVEEAAEKADQTVEESCDGVGEEECLMRRTLAAHVDYIYTQKAKP
ncbi:Phytosulfokines 3 [Melia azedarach]|uniref:Phytosulfokines 3 n=1 Tax=Melia azedarach TaxID=155640 RepID=A0ACC1XYT1_MELAZ|nr:Phytosulfokines 3 [Melia azedarach]